MGQKYTTAKADRVSPQSGTQKARTIKLNRAEKRARQAEAREVVRVACTPRGEISFGERLYSDTAPLS